MLSSPTEDSVYEYISPTLPGLFNKWLSGGFSHRAKQQCKGDCNIVARVLRLVSANIKQCMQ